MSQKGTIFTVDFEANVLSKKITNLNEERRKKKPRSLKAAAKAAVRRYCAPELLSSIEEPKGLASGRTPKKGGFVHAEDDKEKDEDRKDDK